jgi:hypothetical protein
VSEVLHGARRSVVHLLSQPMRGCEAVVVDVLLQGLIPLVHCQYDLLHVCCCHRPAAAGALAGHAAAAGVHWRLRATPGALLVLQLLLHLSKALVVAQLTSILVLGW